MHNSAFKLVTIKEVKSKYPFLHDHQGFDYFDQWDDDNFFLVADKDVFFDSNFHLDIYEDKIKKWYLNIFDLPFKTIDEFRIEGILIDGNTFINGSIINAEGDYGPYVFINGNVSCKSLLVGGSCVEINGNVTAKEVVMTYYNHGNFNCTGLIEAPVFIVTDHNTKFAERKNDLFYYNDTDDIHPENECEYDDETGDEIISNQLRKLLDNPLIETFEELERDLARGELVLKQSKPGFKTFAYWELRVRTNYRDLKLVPSQYKTKELCEVALENTFHALPYVNKEFITPELCEKLVKKDGFAIQLIPDHFITKDLCFKAAESGTILRLIPGEYYSEELIVLVFKNGKHEPDINDVPLQFITKSLLVEYVKLGKGLWLDKACKGNGIDKLDVLKLVIKSGVEYLENIFGNHFSQETADYAALVYDNESFKVIWNNYVQKYKHKFERLGK